MRYEIPIGAIPQNVAVYRLVDNEFVFVDVNRVTEQTEQIHKADVMNRKLLDVFPKVKEFGLYDLMLQVFKTGKSEVHEDRFYEDSRISGWRRNHIIRLANQDIMVLYEDLTRLKELESHAQLQDQQIEASEQKFQSIADSEFVGIFIYDKTIVYANQVFCDLLGYSQSELSQFSPIDLVFAEQKNAVQKAIERRLKGEQFQQKYDDLQLVTKSGQIKNVRMSTETILYQNRYMGMGTLVDITNLIETKQQLTMLAQVIKQTDDLVKIVNAEGHILFVNQSMVNNSGFSEEELVGAHTRILKSNRQDAAFYQDLWQTIKAGQVFHGVFLNKKKGGELFYEEETITPILNDAQQIEFFVSTGTDITERMQMEQALKESEQNFRNIFDNANDGIVILSPEGILLEVNKLMEQRLGYSAAELIGKGVDFIHPSHNDEAANIAMHLKELHDNGKILFETTHLSKQGRLIPVEINSTVIEFRNQPATLSLVRDITKRKEDERGIQALTMRLSLATKAAHIGIWEWDIINNQFIWDATMDELYDWTVNNTPDRMTYFWKSLDQQDRFKVRKQVKKALKGEAEFNVSYQIHTPQNRSKIIQSMAYVELDNDNNPVKMIGVNWDISQQKAYEQRLKENAYLDGLTGISNRRQFDHVFDVEWRRAARQETPLSVCMIDIDYFKNFNDVLGHGEGDDCLKQVAKTIAQNASRAGELAARYGGEEFVVLLPNTSAHEALIVAQAICDAVAALKLAHPNSSVAPFVTISVGSATCDFSQPVPLAAEDLIKQADIALYQAKKSGRNRTEFYNPQIKSDCED